MKKLAIISAIAFSGLLYNTADAQFGINIGIHLFPHRVEYAPGPVVLAQAPVYQDAAADQYTNDNDFYYLPDVGAYYSVDEQLYYYFDGQEWISAAYLPGVHRDYDWRFARRVEIREARPYLHNDFYKNRYQGFDNDLAQNHDRFREGFGFHQNRDTYNAPQHFDNRSADHHFDRYRGEDDQHFDNRVGNDGRFENRGNNRQSNWNHDGFDRNSNGDNRENNSGRQQFDQGSNKSNFQQQYGQNRSNAGNNRNKYGQPSLKDRGYTGH